jgi:polyisoprenoid-binding protein YceI
VSTWKIDPAHTDVLFSAKHMMVTTVRGSFGDIDGRIELDEAEPTRSSGRFTIQAASLDTNVAQRDAHLRSPDFFDVDRFPAIEFVSTGIERRGDDRYAVTGDLTIRDVTRPATFDVEVLGFYPSMQGGRRLGLSASAKLDREAWGLTWNVSLESGGWLVSKEIKVEIELALDEVSVPAVEAPEAMAAAR